MLRSPPLRKVTAYTLLWTSLPTVMACSDEEPASAQPSHPTPDAGPDLDPVDAALVGMEFPTLMSCEGGTASAAAPWIDDLSDGDGAITQVDGRNGHWVTSNDGTGTQAPRARAALLPEPVMFDGGEDYMVHTSGSGFSGWGAAVGFPLHVSAGSACLYNASQYQGIRFEASGEGTLRIEVSVPETIAASAGGGCAGDGCDNRHGFPIELSSDRTRYQVGFNQLAQESGFGQPALFDSSRILEIRFRALPGQSFDVWLDDIGFFPDLRPHDDAGSDAGLDAMAVDGG